MNIGIYDPYLDTMGGGEKYMLTAASCLSKNNNVSIFWEQKSVQEIKKIANSRFGFDLSSIRFTKNIFSKNISFLERHTQLRKYDAIFYLSDGSIPLLLSRKLVLHFQFPVNWVCASLLTRTKFASIKNVVCNSYYTKKYIDKTFSTKSIVVYPPANDYEFKKIPKKNIILTVGRFNPMPGGGNFKKLDVMITIFKEMIDTGAKNWELYVVASFKKQEEGEIAKLEETVENYPIFIMKNIPYEKLNDFYLRSKIYWHGAGYGEDLENHPERAEHFGIATVEAMKNGAVPVVISAGGQPEIVKEGVNGFLWNTKEELIRKTIHLIENPKILEKISQNSRLISNTFSMEKFCSEINSVFK